MNRSSSRTKIILGTKVENKILESGRVFNKWIKTRMGTNLVGMFPSTFGNLSVSLSARLRLLKLAVSSGFFNHFSQP
jgi:hypothetical protein